MCSVHILFFPAYVPVIDATSCAHFFDGTEPTVFPNVPTPVSRHDANFSLCTIPKNGCSQWRWLTLRLLGHQEWRTGHYNVHQAVYPNIRMPPYGRSFFDANPSFVFVRNPYVRFFSYFYDKVQRNHNSSEMLKEVSVVVQRLLAEKQVGLPCDEHYCPQTLLCGMNAGLEYSHTLKVENISQWFPEAVRMMGLSDFIWQDWPNGGCFWKPVNMSCHAYRAAFVPSDHGPNCMLTSHSTCAAERLPALDKLTARMLSHYYKDDLKRFNYQAWNGDPKDFNPF